MKNIPALKRKIEILSYLVRGKSLAYIGRRYKVSRQAISQKLKNSGIEYGKTDTYYEKRLEESIQELFDIKKNLEIYVDDHIEVEEVW